MRIRLSVYIAIHAVPSDWLIVAAGRQRRAAVEDADIVEPEKPALEDVAALGVLAVHPPGEIQHQLVEDAFEEMPGRLAPPRCSRSIS